MQSSNEYSREWSEAAYYYFSDAQDERIGERIAEQCLKGDASHRQRSANECREQGAHLDASLVTHHDVRMRTTLTLDDDLAKELQETEAVADRSRK